MINTDTFLKLTNIAIELNKYLRCGNEGFSAQKITELTNALPDVMKQYSINNDQHLNNLLNVMFDAQQRRDNLFFADILAYELIPYLKQVIQE